LHYFIRGGGVSWESPQVNLSSFAVFYLLQGIYGSSASITLEHVTFIANLRIEVARQYLGDVSYSLNLHVTSALMASLFCPSLQMRTLAAPSPPTAMGGSLRTQPPSNASNALWENIKIKQTERPTCVSSAQRVGLETAVQLDPAALTARSAHQVTSAPTLA
jgi:hypothetical protein